MIIDNKRNIYRIWLRKMVFTIIFTASIVAVMFLNVFDSPESPISKYHVIIAIAVVFIVISLIGIFRNPYYFYFDDVNEVLVFRYYPVGLFNSSKSSVQIPKQQFVRFEIEKYFLGREERLVLFQNYRKKVARYKPINLSAVDPADRKKLKAALTRYSREK